MRACFDFWQTIKEYVNSLARIHAKIGLLWSCTDGKDLISVIELNSIHGSMLTHLNFYHILFGDWIFKTVFKNLILLGMADN